jgi:hypothetical protein
MPMSSGLTSSLSEFTKKSDFAKSPLATESAREPALQSTKPNPIARTWAWLSKPLSFAFARYLLVFFVGIAATLGWQWYSGAARKTVASWSPRLSWLAPAAAPNGISPNRIKATSLALAAVHQSVDKLATEVSKLEAEGVSDRTAAPAPSRRGSRRP